MYVLKHKKLKLWVGERAGGLARMVDKQSEAMRMTLSEWEAALDEGALETFKLIQVKKK